jgi:hypothetical protein
MLFPAPLCATKPKEEESMYNRSYSDKENEVLLAELKKDVPYGFVHQISKEDLENLSEMWPGLFAGTERSPYALHRQIRRLASKNGLKARFKGCHSLGKKIPISSTSETPSVNIPPPPIQKKGKFKLQIEGIIFMELNRCAKRIAQAVNSLTKDLVERKQELAEENKRLQQFKFIAEREFRKVVDR